MVTTWFGASHLALHAKAKRFVCQRRGLLDKVSSQRHHVGKNNMRNIQNADTWHVQEKGEE